MPRRSCGKFHASTATRSTAALTCRSEDPEAFAFWRARRAFRERDDEGVAEILPDGPEAIRTVVAVQEFVIALLAETQPVAGRIRRDLSAAEGGSVRQGDQIVQ